MCKQLERSGLVALCLSFQTNLSKFPIVYLYIFYFMEFLRNKNKYSKSPSIEIGTYSLISGEDRIVDSALFVDPQDHQSYFYSMIIEYISQIGFYY